MIGTRGATRFLFRGLLNHHMGIGPPYTKGANSRAPGGAVASPLAQLCINIEWAISKINLSIRCLIIEARGKHFVLKGKHCFNQPCDASSPIQVPYICFRGTECAKGGT